MAWAVLDGAERWCWSLLAATGASATTEDAGDEVPHHHRHLHPSKRSCGALDKEGEQGARRHCSYWRDRRRAMKKMTLTAELKL